MDETLVRHIARLSRIELREDELERLARELDTIISYFDKLRELDTTAVQPLVHAVEDADVLAPDDPVPSLGAEAALANAPRHDGSFFCVPRILGADW
jgi:aspartyl-tRNA(Asn)/glutamyl-tRNA(Gln) amidotransferase subunit C